jgi:hypothetical protein
MYYEPGHDHNSLQHSYFVLEGMPQMFTVPFRRQVLYNVGVGRSITRVHVEILKLFW